MRGLYIIVEGPTEEQFVNEVLSDHFARNGIFDVRPILMSTSKGHKGGAISYGRFKVNVQNLLKRESDIVVTSLIDFFQLDTDFPNYNQSLNIQDKFARVLALERSIFDDINNNRFFPYIQLHEFEGLLFSDVRGFEYFDSIGESNIQELRETVNAYENPEMINDGELTAPSKRLQRLIPAYRKVLHGPIIALENTLPVTILRCTRFRFWIENLVNSMRIQIYD